MRGIIGEYGEYLISFVTAVGILAFLAVLVRMLGDSIAAFAESLC